MARFDLDQYPLWTALVTPLNESGAIDFDCLTQLVSAQAQAQNGVLLLGSTGEGLALTDSEHRTVVEHVVSLQIDVPLMVAVGGADLAAQSAWIAWCNDKAVDGYLLATPMYAKPGPVGQQQWFGELLDTATHPCMIYNVPSRSGINLDVNTLGALSHHDNFWAIKEASGDLALFEAYAEACQGVRVYSGDDALYPAQAGIGAAGLVSVCANAWPVATHNYVSYHLSNRNEQIDNNWQQALDYLGQGAANPIPVKVLMHRLGQMATPYLRAPLTHLELSSDEHLLSADNLISDWAVAHLQTFSGISPVINQTAIA